MRPLSLALALSALLSPLALSAGEREINAHWQGAWVLTRTPTRSGCNSLYTNNEVRGDLAVGNGSFSFAAGELAQVAKVNVNRQRLEVFLDLAETVLAERPEGPFTLYEETACRVELRIARPNGDDAAINVAIAAAVERHASVAEARDSEAWNERRRADYPADYDATLAAYEVWHAQQVNAQVQGRLDEAIEEAARLTRRVDDDPDYLAGLAAGIDHGRDEYYSDDCSLLLDKTAYGVVDGPPRGRPDTWEEGYGDGQRLLFFTEMAKRLRGCFVPPPPG